VQRHIFQLYPGKSPQVTSFCVFQCLVWQLDRSEVMGSGLFWFGSIKLGGGQYSKKGKKGLGLHIDSAPGFWMKLIEIMTIMIMAMIIMRNMRGVLIREKLEVYAVGDGQSSRLWWMVDTWSNYSDKS